MKNRVTVIGAGFAGMSAAARLARAGYEVDVFEKNQGPGGKASSVQIGGFRFDKGPSFYSMHHVFEELFESCG
ncbi:MAG: FAD-dependent oxidoreductase, partial [Spirochaetales bacterium]|nr:FAD-dependent oxidoreductase [Spirochaetales bacterium]